jgi:hypothetical protein
MKNVRAASRGVLSPRTTAQGSPSPATKNVWPPLQCGPYKTRGFAGRRPAADLPRLRCGLYPVSCDGRCFQGFGDVFRIAARIRRGNVGVDHGGRGQIIEHVERGDGGLVGHESLTNLWQHRRRRGSGRFAMRLHYWFAISLMMAIASVVGVFIFIPLVSAHVFWIAVAAYVILASSRKWWF